MRYILLNKVIFVLIDIYIIFNDLQYLYELVNKFRIKTFLPNV